MYMYLLRPPCPSLFCSFDMYFGVIVGLIFVYFAQRYVFQYEVKINRAGDLSSRTFELELYSDPGAFLATAINRADSYKKGYRNSLTWDMVT